MRNISKMTTLENKFPLLAIEGNCIISKDADVTAVYRVELPELFTVTASEYEAIHSTWHKAIRVLPHFTVVHKQDWFLKENYHSDIQKDEVSFLSRSYERHFNERPFLNHECYLYLTKTTKQRMALQSNFTTLCRGSILPKEIKDEETVLRFLESVSQFERIMNDSGFIILKRLNASDISRKGGLLERYFTLGGKRGTPLKDIAFGADE
uniref:TraG family conjugative transposon ATPase n=1 Tax=uncultured Proteiniphilum sp. TaxID=497637 RepID=UPI00262F147F